MTHAERVREAERAVVEAAEALRRKVANRYTVTMALSDASTILAVLDGHAAALAAARAEGAAEAYEKAANKCDEFAESMRRIAGDEMIDAYRGAAEAIRALAERERGGRR